MTSKNLDLKKEQQITENKNYIMKEITSQEARDVVKEYHYSGKVVNNSTLHLGVFSKEDGLLSGVLSFGYPMNPTKTPAKLVKNSTAEDMFELNRMAMRDDAPKFSESQAIGLSIKWLKRFRKDKKWLLSYSDGKEGNVGTIYQATNWDYYGYNVSSSFWDLDGEVIHAVTSWGRHRKGRTDGKTEREVLLETYDNVSKIHSKQYIYIYPLAKDIEVLRDKVEEYPKRGEDDQKMKRVWHKKDGKIVKK